MADKNYTYRIGFEVDDAELKKAQTTIEEVKKALLAVQTDANAQHPSKSGIADNLKEAGKAAEALDKALDKAFNRDLNTINVAALEQELRKAGYSAETAGKALIQGGEKGAAAFARLGSKILETNVQVKQTNKLLDEMWTSMKNTVKWGITSSIMNTVSNSIQQAWGYAKALDGSLNDIRIVTGYSADRMDEFAEKANKAAKALGQSTTDYTKASLIYFQQGLSDEEVAARTDVTLKAANVTGQSTAQVSEQLTAVWNGYKVSAEEAESYVDKLAAVAATTASDLEELSTGMSKVASAANSMGVDVDQLNAQLATIVSVTRQAPESVGTALKTIYARMGDLKVDGEDEFGTKLGEVSGTMQTMGIEVTDQMGNLREMGEVIEEVAAKWDTWTDAQKQAAAVAMAGKRQYNNLIALFDNWDMYTNALNTSQNSLGTLQQQQDIYMESTAAHLAKMKTAAEGFYDSLIDTNQINSVIDRITLLIGVLEKFTDAFGGGLGAVGAFVGTLSSVFSQKIGTEIANFQGQKIQQKNNEYLTSLQLGWMKTAKAEQDNLASSNPEDKAAMAKLDSEIQGKERILTLTKSISQEEFNRLNDLNSIVAKAKEEATLDKERYEVLKDQANVLNRTTNLNNIDGTSRNGKFRFGKKLDDAKYRQNKANELDDEIEAFTTELNAETAKGLPKKPKTKQEKQEQVQHKQRIAFLEEEIKKRKELLEAIKKIDEADEQRQGSARNSKDQETQLQLELEKAEAMQWTQARTVALTSTISNLTVAYGALNSAMSIWADESMSFGEKVLSTFMALAPAIGMIITNLNRMKDALPNGMNTSIFDLITKGRMKDTAAAAAQAAANEIESASEEKNQKEMQESAIVAEELAGAELSEAGATGVQAGANKIKGAGEAMEGASKSAGLLSTSIGTLTFALTAAIAAFAIYKGAMSWFGKQYEKDAEAHANRAKAYNNEVQNQLKLVDSTNTLINKQKALASEVDNGTKSFADAKQEIIELAKEYDNWDLVGKLESGITTIKELEEELNNLKIEENNKVIESVNNAGGATEASIRNNLRSDQEKISGRGTEEAYKLGNGFSNDLQNIFSEFGIKGDYSSGKVYTYDLAKAMTENGEALREALAKEGSAEANELLKIFDENAALLNEWSETQQAGQNAAKENIGLKYKKTTTDENGNTIVGIEDIQSYEQYEELAKTMADEAKDFFPSEEEALDWAESYIAKYNEVAQYAKITDEKIKQLDFLPEEEDDKDPIYGKGFIAAQQKQIDEAKTAANGGVGGFGSYDQDATNAWLNKHTKTDENGNRHFLKSYTDDFGEKVNEVPDEVKQFVEGYNTWLKFVEEGADTSFEAFSKALEDGFDVEKIRSEELRESKDIDAKRNKVLNHFYQKGMGQITEGFAPADWETILNSDDPIGEAEKVAEKMGTQFKEVFKSSIAGGLGEDAASVLEKLDLNPEKAVQTDEYNNLIKNKDMILKNAPGLEDEFEIVSDKSLAGTEQFKQALETIQATMVAMKTDEDGFYTAEEAKKDQMSVDKLKDALAEGAMDKEEFYSKLQGTIENELETISMTKDEYDEYVKSLEDSSDALQGNEKAAKRIAIANAKIMDGIDKLEKNMKDYSKELKNTNKGTIAYGKAMGELKNDLKDVFDVEVSDDFISEHLKDIEALANGDLSKLEELQKAASQDYIAHLEIDGADDAEIADLRSKLNGYIENMDLENIEVGASLDDTGFVEALNSMLISGQITAEEANKILSSIGYDPVIDYKEVPMEVTHDVVTSIYGGENKGGTVTSTATSTSMVKMPVVNAKETVYRGAGKAMPRSGGKKGGGGGGGGGGKDPEFVDYLEDERDIFHDINIEIEKNQRLLDQLADAQDKLTGANLVKNMNEQIAALTKQIALNKEKIKIAQQEADLLRKQGKDGRPSLEAQGVKFNPDGTVANYDEVMSEMLKKTNDEIERYNKMSAAEQEATKDKAGKTLADRAKENYEKFKEDFEKYEELINQTIKDLKEQIDSAKDQITELQIKKFNMKIEIELDLRDATKKYNEWYQKVIKGNADKGIGTGQLGIKDLKTDLNSLPEVIKHVQDLTTINKNFYKNRNNKDYTDSIYGKDAAAAQEDLNQYLETLYSVTEEIEDEIKSIEEGYLNTIDEVSEAFENLNDNVSRVNDLIDNSLELTKKLYGEDNYDKQEVFFNQKDVNYKQQATYYREQQAYWKNLLDKEEQGSEAWKKYKEEWEKATDSLNETVNESVDNLIAKYQNAVNKIFKDLERGFTGGRQLEYLSEEWELINKQAEIYLDTINRTFETQSLKDKWMSAIDGTKDIAIQRELNSLMDEQLKKLEEKGELTQYDIDRANKEYEIAVKRIALEEAQRNKSQMKLRRDSQGNYTYQYVSDNDQVAKAQEELNKLQNDLYNFDKDAYKNNLDQMLSIYQEYVNRMREISQEEYITGNDLSDQKELVKGYYQNIIDSYSRENGFIKDNLGNSAFDSLEMMYNHDSELFKNMTNLNISSFDKMTDSLLNDTLNEMVPGWDGAIQHMIDTVKAEGGLEAATKEAFENLKDVTLEYQESLDELADVAGVDFESITFGTNDAATAQQEFNKALEVGVEDAQKFLNEFTKKGGLNDQAKALKEKYEALKSVIESTAKSAKNTSDTISKDTQKALDSLDGAIEKLNDTIKKLTAQIDNLNRTQQQAGSGDGGGNGSDFTGGIPTDKDKTGDTPKIKKFYVIDVDGAGSKIVLGKADSAVHASQIASAKRGKENKFAKRDKNGQSIQRTYKPSIVQSEKDYGVSNEDTLRKVYFSGKTGGYTGTWAGSDTEENGRLGFLHQKELVLNKDDTENMLDSIKLLRQMDIQKMLEDFEQAIRDRANAELNALNTPMTKISTGQTLEQAVHIEANFPNVSQRKEIEAAFDSLVNRATQYANRKIK